MLPRNIDREIVEIMHRTRIGVDQDYENIMKQGTRAAIADGWGDSMRATDLQDILFGTPYPVASEANLAVMKEDMVNSSGVNSKPGLRGQASLLVLTIHLTGIPETVSAPPLKR